MTVRPLILTIAVLATLLLAVIAVDDLRNHRIRNRNLNALAAIIVLGLGARAIPDGDSVLVGAALGAVLGSAPLFLAALVQPAHMGGGDEKLAVLTGPLLGMVDPWLSIAALGAALVLTLPVLILRHASHAPLAPSLAATVAALALHAIAS